MTGISVGITAIHSYQIGCHRSDKVLGKDSKFHTKDIMISQEKKPHMDKEADLLYAICKENSDLSTVKSALK